MKAKLNFKKEVNIKTHNLTITTQSNKKLKRNPLFQVQITILDIPINAVFGSRHNGKINEFQNTLSQQLSNNLTQSFNNKNSFTQILKEVCKNDNNVEPKFFQR